MKEKKTVELLLNPFCMADRDKETFLEICSKLDVELAIYNTWEMTDDRLPELPDYMQTFISDIRNGVKPGSVYSHVFVDGKRLQYKSYDDSTPEKAEQFIKAMIGERR